MPPAIQGLGVGAGCGSRVAYAIWASYLLGIVATYFRRSYRAGLSFGAPVGELELPAAQAIDKKRAFSARIRPFYNRQQKKVGRAAGYGRCQLQK